MDTHRTWRVTPEGVVQSKKTLPMEEIMFGDYLERVFIEHSDRIAIVDTETDKEYTYGEVLEISRSIAAVLQRRGVQPHDEVVLCAMTGVKSCCFILALAFCQAAVLATKHIYSVFELGEVLKNFPSLKLIVGDNASVAKLRQATSVDVLNLEENWDLNRTSEFKKPGRADPRSSIMLMLLTSGTTGPSKAVRKSHYNIMGDLTQWTSGPVRCLMCNPISHMSGYLISVLRMASAATLVIASEKVREDLHGVVDLCSKYKVETGLLMPVLFTKLTEYGPTDKLATVKSFSTAGSTIPQPIIDEFRSLHPHIRVEVMYGSSEAGIILKSANQSKIDHLAVLNNVEVKLLDLDTSEIVGVNQKGMLYCKAASVAVGYHNNEQATKEAFIDGWHVTGDLAIRDEEGCFVIADRLKQMIKCMDSQVAPGDLELLLSSDDEVLNVLVAGVPHEKFGEAAVAFVVPRKGADLGELRKRLMSDLQSKLVFYKHLHGGLFFVETIPQTDTGKFSRRDVVDKHIKNEIEYLD